MASIGIYRTYNFIDKDPVIDEIRTIVQDEGMMARLSDLGTLSGVSPQTLTKWFRGATRKPHNATVMAVVTSLGYERRFVKAKQLKVEEELPIALAWLKKERAKMAAKADAQKARKRKKKGAAK